jgi:large subunit ribosomal protein L2
MKKYAPTTPSRRNMVTINYREYLTASKPHKPLTKGVKRDVGRNGAGRITVRHKGGGHKRLYRDIDFKYTKIGIPAKIETVEYDPNRSGFISLVCYKDGARAYHLLPKELKVGDIIVSDENADVKVGNRLPLVKLPVGTFIYNIETKPGAGAKFVRSAGSYAEVVSHDAGYTAIKMPSSEIHKLLDTCWASVGEVSNDEHKLVKYGKAGRSRWMGIRPTVRGTAMNPVDHPYGGGEGVQGRGTRRPKTKWGKVTGGRKTRHPKKYSNHLIVSRRKVGKRR